MTRKSAPADYAEAIVEAQRMVREGRLADPGEHYPYKRDEAVAAGLPEGVADACQRYVAAQQAYLTDPGDGTRGEYEAAKQELVAARRDVRIREQRLGFDTVRVTGNEG